VALRIEYRPFARADLKSIYDYIAEESRQRALSYVRDIEDRCERLADAPHVGSRRPELAQDLRVIGFRRRVAICFRVGPETVEIVRILYGGRDLASALGEVGE